MPEPVTDPADEVVTPPDPAPDPPADLGEGGVKALDSERAARKAAEKQARELAAKVAEFENANKTELEKLAERAATAEKAVADAEAKLMRSEVAGQFGLPPELAGRLQGGSIEELTADAEQLKALLAPKPQPAGNGRMGETLRPAGASETDVESLDPRVRAAAVDRWY